MQPLVSILIPAFNAKSCIGETVQSALGQTWPRKEIIIVDDGSTDDTLTLAKRFESKLLKVLHHDRRGVSKTRNAGLMAAQGDLIQFLDADDILHPFKIESQAKALAAEGNETLATGRFGAFYYRLHKAVLKDSNLCRDLDPVEWLMIRFAENCWMASHAWLTPRRLIDRAGNWDERLVLDEDGEFFCRLVSLCKAVKFVPEAEAYYRVGNLGSLSNGRTQRAMESLLLAMELSIGHLRSLEDSERTRKACVKFIQHTLLSYYSNEYGIMERAEKLANCLGGTSRAPDVGWKIAISRDLLGFKNTLKVINLKRRFAAKAHRSLDYVLFKLERQKI